jgi:hypothetical protein
MPVKASTEWLIALVIAPVLAILIKVFSRRIGSWLPEGRIKRLLTREFGPKQPPDAR